MYRSKSKNLVSTLVNNLYGSGIVFTVRNVFKRDDCLGFSLQFKSVEDMKKLVGKFVNKKEYLYSEVDKHLGTEESKAGFLRLEIIMKNSREREELLETMRNAVKQELKSLMTSEGGSYNEELEQMVQTVFSKMVVHDTEELYMINTSVSPFCITLDKLLGSKDYYYYTNFKFVVNHMGLGWTLYGLSEISNNINININ